MQNINKYPYLIIGTGFFGSVIAERIANELKYPVLMIEKRKHIGGNCFSEIDPETQIEVHKYGSHIFHTSNEKVWKYISQFTSFNNYRHKVLTKYQDKIYPMPINLETINWFYNLNLQPNEAQDFLKKEALKEQIIKPHNFEEKIISQIGRPLYEAFIKGYTMKQWEQDPKNLPESIINRLPIRTNYNRDYFDDKYQGIPTNGYTRIFEKMLSNPLIDLQLNMDYFSIKDSIPKNTIQIYTGPIDQFFNYKYGKLGWRTLDFTKEIYPENDFQGTSVMNYAEKNTPYTRIHEFKHYHPERKYSKDYTIIFKEYSRLVKDNDIPYYPINTEKDKALLKKYETDAMQLKNILFGGRLGSYKYYDMHHTIASALNTFDTIIELSKRVVNA